MILFLTRPVFSQDILEEIEAERKKQESSSDEIVIENEDDSNGIVLVACKDEHSCMQLEDCITNGPKKVILTFMFLYDVAFFYT